MKPSDPGFRRLYPFESRFHDVSGARVHYVDEGSGPPVVMVHGNPTWSFFFRELIKALRPTHRCIAMDHIGCGLSDKPNDECRMQNVELKSQPKAGASSSPFSILHSTFYIPYSYTLSRRVADLESLFDALDLREPATFVLHDWGGMIGMAAALRRPERVARFVLMNTAAFLLPSRKRLPLRLRIIRDTGPLGALIVRGFNGFARPATWMAVRKPLPREVRDAYLMPYDSWANRIATLRFVQDIPLRPGDLSYDLAEWVDERMTTLADRPALICWGMRDFVFDCGFLAEWRRRWPRAEVREFAEAGHYVIEDEGPSVVECAQNFISQQSP